MNRRYFTSFGILSMFISGTEVCAVPIFNVELRCESVSCDQNRDLFKFIEENNCSQT